jgi:hypothetical protein
MTTSHNILLPSSNVKFLDTESDRRLLTHTPSDPTSAQFRYALVEAGTA